MHSVVRSESEIWVRVRLSDHRDRVSVQSDSCGVKQLHDNKWRDFESSGNYKVLIKFQRPHKQHSWARESWKCGVKLKKNLRNISLHSLQWLKLILRRRCRCQSISSRRVSPFFIASRCRRRRGGVTQSEWVDRSGMSRIWMENQCSSKSTVVVYRWRGKWKFRRRSLVTRRDWQTTWE